MHWYEILINFQKLLNLKSKVELLKLIRNLLLIEGNLQDAIDLFEKRYDNKSLNIYCDINCQMNRSHSSNLRELIVTVKQFTKRLINHIVAG